MFFKKKRVEDEGWYKLAEEKEAMLLNMVTNTGLALSPEEKKSLEESGWIDTGKFNGHGQPLLKNVQTGEVLSFCRSNYNISAYCSTYCSTTDFSLGEYYSNTECGRAY